MEVRKGSGYSSLILTVPFVAVESRPGISLSVVSGSGWIWGAAYMAAVRGVGMGTIPVSDRAGVDGV